MSTEAGPEDKCGPESSSLARRPRAPEEQDWLLSLLRAAGLGGTRKVSPRWEHGVQIAYRMQTYRSPASSEAEVSLRILVFSV